MTRARTLADMISDGVIGTTELADDAITPVKLDETGNYTIAQLDVNGTLTSDGLTVASNSPQLVLDDVDSNQVLRFSSGSTASYIQAGTDLVSGSAADLNFGSIYGADTWMKIASNGDISFYDTSGNAKFFWDASAERLGIGTTSPSEKLDVAGTIEADKIVAAVGGSGTSLSADRYMGVRNTGGDAHMQVICADTTGLAGITFGRNSDNVAAGMAYDASNHAVLFYGHDYAERMRIDSSGNLLVGTTDTQPPTNSDVSGIALRSDGKIAASRDNGIAADFNNNNAGNIAWFRKNGTVVATVSTRTGGGDAPYFGGYTNADTGIAFSSARMYPVTSSGVVANGTRDLGNFDAKWKDLYLSGGIQFDSRSNKLDDYEEGTWTPVLSSSSGESGQSYNTQAGAYTKVGSLVYCSGWINVASIGTLGGSYALLKGLPYTVGSGNQNYGGGVIQHWSSFGVNSAGFTIYTEVNTTYCYIHYRSNFGTTATYMPPAGWGTSPNLMVTITYRTDA
jgi:hypothetical protein